jgi:hypothetical protein
MPLFALVCRQSWGFMEKEELELRQLKSDTPDFRLLQSKDSPG